MTSGENTMKIDFNSIAEHLSYSFDILRKQAGRSKRCLSHFMIYDGHPLESGALCIVPHTHYASFPDPGSDSAFIVIGEPDGFQLPPDSCMLILDPASSLPDVVNSVQRLFIDFTEWCTSLYQTFCLGKGIQSLISQAQPVFENPVYVHDKHYRFFAYAEDRSKDPENWNYDFYGPGQLSAETISNLLNSPRFAATFETTAPTYYKREEAIEDFDYLYVNLRVNGNYAGRLFVDERVRPIRALDYLYLEELGRIIEFAMNSRSMLFDSSVDLVSAALSSLANDEAPDDSETERIMTELDWIREKGCRCVLFESVEDDSNQNIASGICDILNNELHECRAFIHNGQVLAIIPGKEEGRRRKTSHALSAIAGRYGLHAGISRVCTDLYELHLYNKQAQIALSCVQTKNPSDNLLYYDNHILSYLMKSVPGDLPAEMLCPKSLLDLKAYDAAKGTQYTETLRAFLEENLSPTRVCERLHLHRSTFMYRLNRINDMISDDFNDPDTKLLYLIAFRLL